VYKLAEATKAAIGAEKRRNGMARALRYIEQLGASFVFPNAGPPCFLDPELFSLNDTDRDAANIFPDASVFLEFLSDHGHCEGRLLIPGSTADLRGGTDGGGSTCAVTHPFPLAEVEAIFADKQRYLDRYGDRQRSVIASQRASWAAPEMDVLAELKSWFEPLLDRAVHIRAGVGGPVELLVVGDGAAPAGSDRRGDLSIVIDFAAGVVRPGRDVDVLCRHRFRVGRSLVERLIADHEIDWSNSLFLSMRFSAQRTGPYNEFLYTFLKCLSLPRIEYAERWYSSREDSAEDTVIGDWCVQRRCPHLRADLSRFGVIDEETLTCRMHGWQWDLESGACLTSAGHPLRSRRVRAELAAASVPVESVPAGSVPIVAVPAGSVPVVAVPAGSVPVVAVPAGSVPEP
jgi:UDP-MurNAc hydroxylase